MGKYFDFGRAGERGGNTDKIMAPFYGVGCGEGLFSFPGFLMELDLGKFSNTKIKQMQEKEETEVHLIDGTGWYRATSIMRDTPPQDPSEGLCLGSCGGHRGGGCFL